MGGTDSCSGAENLHSDGTPRVDPEAPLRRARHRFVESLSTRIDRIVDALERAPDDGDPEQTESRLATVRRELLTLGETAATLRYVPLQTAASLLGSALDASLASTAGSDPESLDGPIEALIAASIGACLENVPWSESAPRTRHPPPLVMVDDHVELLNLFRARLELAGFEVLSFVDGREALDVLRATSPVAVISDWRMPELDGEALLRRIRAQPNFEHLPLIVFSSCDSPDDVAQMHAAGANEVVSKTSSPMRLLRAIARQVDLACGYKPLLC